MLTLKEWMELVDCRITEGGDYYTNIQGLYSLSAWNEDHEGWSFFVAFDPRDNQRVYVVEVCDYANNRAYRLKDPEIKLDKQAWDDVDFVELESDDDFIQKGLAIKAGEEYDTRVSVPLDLPDDMLFDLMKQAHERDITLNQLMEEVLLNAIERIKEDHDVDVDLNEKSKSKKKKK